MIWIFEDLSASARNSCKQTRHSYSVWITAIEKGISRSSQLSRQRFTEVTAWEWRNKKIGTGRWMVQLLRRFAQLSTKYRHPERSRALTQAGSRRVGDKDEGPCAYNRWRWRRLLEWKTFRRRCQCNVTVARVWIRNAFDEFFVNYTHDRS